MARIGIDLTRRIGTVDRRIFGNFIEHLGRCIYGGIWAEMLEDPDQKISRPRQIYTGARERTYVPIEKRK